MGHPWPGAASPASMPGSPLRNTCVRPPTSRDLWCLWYRVLTPFQDRQWVSGIGFAPTTATPVGARLPAMTSEHSLQNLIETHSMARDAAILRTPPNERREAEWRCRGVGRSAWMPSERRWATDGPSARAHTTVPERRDPWEPGAGRQRKMVSPLCRNKGGRPSGRNQNSATQQILMVPPDQKV